MHPGWTKALIFCLYFLFFVFLFVLVLHLYTFVNFPDRYRCKWKWSSVLTGQLRLHRDRSGLLMAVPQKSPTWHTAQSGSEKHRPLAEEYTIVHTTNTCKPNIFYRYKCVNTYRCILLLNMLERKNYFMKMLLINNNC